MGLVMRRALRGWNGRTRAVQGERERGRAAAFALTAGGLILVGAYVAAIVFSLPDVHGREAQYNSLIQDIGAGRVADVTILTEDHRIIGTDAGRPVWIPYGDATSPVFNGLFVALAEAGVNIRLDDQFVKGLLRSPAVVYGLPALLIGDAIVLGYVLSQSGLLKFGRSGSRRVIEGETGVTFADVAGLDEAVTELAEIRGFLGDPGRFAALGARVPRGILLAGPPGCGKTLLARALAGDAGARFFSISGSSFVEMFAGVGAARIRSLFREASAAAPSIIFIDELDAVGRGRGASGSGDTQAERESTLNQLLVALDGFDTSSGVVVIAATNRPDILDPALLRAGRFDRHVVIGPPDLKGRLAILDVHVRDKPMAEDVDLAALGRRTAGFSGADLAGVVNEAALLAARYGTARIAMPMLWEAVDRAVSGPERRSRLFTPREKELTACHEAGHSVVAATLSPDEPVGKISIVARGIAAGVTWYPQEERIVATREDLMTRLAVLLAGRAAEEAVLGVVTSASESDLQRATDLARRMAGELGMGAALGPISLKPPTSWLDSHAGARPSPEMAALFDGEVRSLLAEGQEAAAAVVRERRALVERLARRLIEMETLEGSELEALLYGPQIAAVTATR